MTDTAPAPTVAPPPVPLLVNATSAAAIVGVSRVVWWNLNRSARCPRPLALSRRAMWRADELRRWVEAGAPPRAVWDQRKGAKP